MHFSDLFSMAKVVTNFVITRTNQFEANKLVKPEHLAGQPPQGKTEVLRGRLDEEQTAELIAMMEEDDASLHGVILAASLIATSRILQGENSKEYPPKKTLNLRATNEANLRQYCDSGLTLNYSISMTHLIPFPVLSGPKHGCLTTYYEQDYSVPPITDRTEFWRLDHHDHVFYAHLHFQ